MRKHQNRLKIAALAIMAVLSIAACKNESKSDQKDASVEMNDKVDGEGEQAGVLMALHEIESVYLEIGREMYQSEKVGKYAESLLREVKSLQGKTQEVIKSKNISLEESDLKKSLISNFRKQAETLKSTSKEDFDIDFMKTLYDNHLKMLKLQEAELYRNVESKELQDLFRMNMDLYKKQVEINRKFIKMLEAND